LLPQRHSTDRLDRQAPFKYSSLTPSSLSATAADGVEPDFVLSQALSPAFCSTQSSHPILIFLAFGASGANAHFSHFFILYGMEMAKICAFRTLGLNKKNKTQYIHPYLEV
jgi:hypothetical protein